MGSKYIVTQHLDRFKFRYYDFRTKNMSYSAEVALFRQIIDMVKGEGILMQATGLYDKNDKLIYEGDVLRCELLDENGDIVEDDEALYVVGFQEASFGTFFNYNKKNKKHDDFEAFPTESEARYQNYEIIGNIYKNLELLERT